MVALSVNDDHSIPGHPEVQAIGAWQTLRIKPESPCQGSRRATRQRAKQRSNILRMIRGEKPQPFRYFDKGSMATIGRNKAVADLKFFHLSGLFAWLAWLFVHIIFLVGFRNRLLVLIQWAWAYSASIRAHV